MKIVEVLNGKVITTIPYWQSKEEIPEDVPNIFFEAPDWVYDGCLYNIETGEFTEGYSESEIIKPVPELTDSDILMLAMTDIYEKLINIEKGI